MTDISLEMQFIAFKKELIYQVAKALKQKKRQPIVTGGLVISIEIFNFLKNEYGLSGRFKLNQEFESTCELISVRFFNECDYTKIKNFTSRISINKDLEIMTKDLKKVALRSDRGLFKFRFFRQNRVV